jgi:hypothetical protein
LGGLPVEGEEQRVRTLLHHLYCAVAMFEGLSPEERALVAGMQKKFRYFFETNCNLKERKRKNEKEKFPPVPSIKEKERKKKTRKTPTLPRARVRKKVIILKHVKRLSARSV